MTVKVHITLRESVTPDEVAAVIRKAGLTAVNPRRLSALGILTAQVEPSRMAALRGMPGVVSVAPDAEHEL